MAYIAVRHEDGSVLEVSVVSSNALEERAHKGSEHHLTQATRKVRLAAFALARR